MASPAPSRSPSPRGSGGGAGPTPASAEESASPSRLLASAQAAFALPAKGETLAAAVARERSAAFLATLPESVAAMYLAARSSGTSLSALVAFARLVGEFDLGDAVSFAGARRPAVRPDTQASLVRASSFMGTCVATAASTPTSPSAAGAAAAASTDSRRVVVHAKPGRIDFGEVLLDDMRRGFVHTLSAAASLHPSAQAQGVVVVLDCQGFSVLGLLAHPAKVAAWTSFERMAIGSAPFKVRRILVVNEPRLFSAVVLPILRTVLKPKIIDRLRTYGSTRSPDSEAVAALDRELGRELRKAVLG